MKTKLLLLLLIVSILFSCKKKDEGPDYINTGTPSGKFPFTDIIPTNKGKNFNLSKDGLKVVIWNFYNDTILVYNTFDGSKQSTIVHPHSFPSGYFQNVMLTDDGLKVISQQDNYEIKVWDALTGGYILDLETVWGWIPMPDGSSIIGWADNLSTREIVKQISLVTGVMIDADTVSESTYPFIVGTDEAGGKYMIEESVTDLNDPGSPYTKMHIMLRDLNSHTYLADYVMSKKSFTNSVIATDNINFFSVVTHDSITNANMIEFYESTTGNWYSDEPFINNYTVNYRMLTPGPGSDRYISVSEDKKSIQQIMFTPSTTTFYEKYSAVVSTHNGFENLDVNKQNTRVAASYEAADGKVHVAVWSAN